MDPEKILAWMQTEAGKGFHDGLVQKAIDTKVKGKELFLPDQVSAQLAEARAEQKTLSENERLLVQACKDIQAIDKTMPESAIRAELEKHPAGPVRDAHISRMKAEAHVLAGKNTPAPTKDPVVALTTREARENARRAKFDGLVAKGVFGPIRDDAHKASLYATYCQNNPT